MTPLHLETDFWCPDLKINEYGTVELDQFTSDIHFEVNCEYYKLDHQFFIGMVNSTDDPETQILMGVVIDPDNGEVTDLINGQGVLGYLEAAPFQSYDHPSMAIEIERINDNFIPVIRFGDERIPHPALRRPDVRKLVATAGSTSCFLGSRARLTLSELNVEVSEAAA